MLDQSEIVTKTCSCCRLRPASTPRTAYCRPCRAAYQRAWRKRARGEGGEFVPPVAEIAPRVRLRGTPTYSEMVRYRLI